MRTPALTAGLTLAALLALAGTAAAAAPSATGWSPANYGGNGQDLALASEASIFGFATADPGDQPGDQDLHFLTLEEGPVASQDDSTILDPEGTDHVVASDDGSALASGVDVGASGPNLHYFTRSDARNGTSTWSEEFARGVSALAITPDGDHLAVATAGDNDGAVRLFETRGGSASTVFEHETDGPIHDVAVGDDGEWVLAGGETVVNGTSQGKVLLYRGSAGSDPVDTYTLEEDLPGAVRTVALTPDARYGLAGTAAGRLASFARSGSQLDGPHITEFEGSQVAALAVHPDGGVVAAAATDGVHVLERPSSGPRLSPVWTHSTGGSVTSLAASRNLTHIVAGVPNPQGAVHAFHVSRPEPIWTIDDGADHVDMDAAPTHVAVGRGSNVTAYALHRSLAVGFPGGDGTLDEEPDSVPVTREDETVHAEVGLRNLGSLADTYEVTASIPGAWNVSVDPVEVQVLPNETEVVDIAMRPSNVAAGRYNASVTVVSQSDGAVRANLSVPVRVEGQADLRMSIDGANATRPVEPGDSPRVFLTVENRGNARTSVDVFARLSPSTSPSWSVDAPSQVGPLGPGGKTSFQVTVHVPENAPDGDARLLEIAVAGSGDRESRSLRFVVNPFRKVELDVRPGTRLVNSTVPGFYNATVENLGSIETSFKFIFERRSSGTPGWTVIARRKPFVIDAGESRTLPIKIVAPQNGAPGDRVLVNVQVVPEDLADQVRPAVEDNTTISAVFRDLPERNEERPFERIGDRIQDIPGPGAGAALMALVASGVAARSKGSNRGERREGRTPRTSETYKNMQAATGDPSAGPPCCWSTTAR